MDKTNLDKAEEILNILSAANVLPSNISTKLTDDECQTLSVRTPYGYADIRRIFPEYHKKRSKPKIVEVIDSEGNKQKHYPF